MNQSNPNDEGQNSDTEPDSSELGMEPRHVPREDVPAISEDEPPAEKESDFVLPAADPVLPDADEAKERWKQEVRDASSNWTRLTEADLLLLESHEKRLADLVQERYGLSRAKAEAQVAAFIEDHQLFKL